MLIFLLSFVIVSQSYVVKALPLGSINILTASGPGTDPHEKYVDPSVSESCGAFGDPKTEGTFAWYLQEIFNVAKFAGIILAIVMSIKDLITVVADQKGDGFKKFGSRSLKRFIYAICIFVLPTILNFVFNLLGLYGTCGIS